jgi:hypothetical protein
LKIIFKQETFAFENVFSEKMYFLGNTKEGKEFVVQEL